MGNGQYLPRAVYDTELTPQDIVLDDFNGDGILDIAVSTFGAACPVCRYLSETATVLFSRHRIMTAHIWRPILLNVAGIASGDVDGDMDRDIIVANEASNDLSVYFNNGDGTFSYNMRAGVYWGATSPVFADFTGDGIKDVAVIGTLPPGGFTSAVTVIRGKYGTVPVELNFI